MTNADAKLLPRVPQYCCWVRLVRVNEDVKRAPVTYFYGDPAQLIMHGSRPPGVVDEGAPNLARDESTVVWAAHPAAFGRDAADTAFEYGPAFSDPSCALRWLGSPAGIAWDRQALNRFLMAVESVHGELPKPHRTPCCSTFPEDDWADAFRFKHLQEDKSGLFDHSKLTLHDPQHYIAGRDEEAILVRAANLRGALREKIYLEAQGEVQAVAPVLEAAAWLADGHPATKQMLAIKAVRQVLLDAVNIAIFKFKYAKCRARPWTPYPHLQPMFRDPSHKYYPGHPSFPSGHATVAYFFALFIAKIDATQDASRLLRVAREVAERREIAGVHFPSDSDAGRHLAEQIVALIFNPNGQPANAAVATLVSSLRTGQAGQDSCTA